ncbi:MAG: hypothetical protein HY823_13365 [Acidobacteria bacterium]|nr:hypothetical protein [Acidobacteriota bacterium]
MRKGNPVSWTRTMGLLGALWATLGAQTQKVPPKSSRIPVRVTFQATWTDTRDCGAGEGECRSCRDEGRLMADFFVEAESDNGLIWRNAQPGSSQVSYLNRSFCPVDGESKRTEGKGSAPIAPWSTLSKGRANLLQDAALSMMMDKPPGALNHARHLLAQHPQTGRADLEADARRIMAARSAPGGGVDREVGLIAPFRKTGHEARSDPQGAVGVHLYVNLTPDRPGGTVSWEERGQNSTWDVVAVRIAGLAEGANKGHQKSTEADSTRVVKYTVSWNFAPPEELQAIPQVAGTVQRGEVLTLDGSASKGQVRQHLWTFRPLGNPGQLPDPAARKEGARSTVILLDSMEVLLTVSDGAREHRKAVQVTVLPREAFKTSFEHVAVESQQADSIRPRCDPTGEKDAQGDPIFSAVLSGGENVCALDPPRNSAEPVHILHPDPKKAGKDSHYTLAQVQDPKGPWNGFWYFKDWKALVHRQTSMNKFLLPEGPPSFPGLDNFFKANTDRGLDAAGYLAAARAHERRHSDLMQKALEGRDPARDTERAFGKDEVSLRSEADQRIRETEKRLSDATADPLRQTWKKDLVLPQQDTYQWRKFSIGVGQPGGK